MFRPLDLDGIWATHIHIKHSNGANFSLSVMKLLMIHLASSPHKIYSLSPDTVKKS